MEQEKTIDLKFSGSYIRGLFLFAIGWLGLSYMLVFNGTFMPGGYEFVSKDGDVVTVVHYNLMGQEEGVITKDFSEEENPHVANYIEPTIDQLKFNYFLQTFVTVMSIILLVYHLKVKKLSVWKAVLNSGIVFNLMPIYIIMLSLERIQNLMS